MAEVIVESVSFTEEAPVSGGEDQYVADSGGVWAPSEKEGLRMMGNTETAAVLNAKDAEIARLREAFDFVCKLLPSAALAIEREADNYVLSCMVNIGELRHVRSLRELCDPAVFEMVEAHDPGLLRKLRNALARSSEGAEPVAWQARVVGQGGAWTDIKAGNVQHYRENGWEVCALSPQPQGGGEGFVSVPVEPTREMWAAGADAVIGDTTVHHDLIVERCWKAMLSAAAPVEGEATGWSFDRYVDGQLMAEGGHISHAATFEEASKKVAGLFRNRPKSVFVLRSGPAPALSTPSPTSPEIARLVELLLERSGENVIGAVNLSHDEALQFVSALSFSTPSPRVSVEADEIARTIARAEIENCPTRFGFSTFQEYSAAAVERVVESTHRAYLKAATAILARLSAQEGEGQ